MKISVPIDFFDFGSDTPGRCVAMPSTLNQDFFFRREDFLVSCRMHLNPVWLHETDKHFSTTKHTKYTKGNPEEEACGAIPETTPNDS